MAGFRSTVYGSSMSSLALENVGRGTSFPLSPVAERRFYRTDLELLCYFDGTRWLTVNTYEFGPSVGDAVSPLAGTAVNERWPVRQDFGMYLMRWNLATLVNTANNGSSFWTMTLAWVSTANASTDIVSANTSADSPNGWVSHDQASLNTVVDSTARQFKATITKTGSPGNIYAPSTLVYRLIVT